MIFYSPSQNGFFDDRIHGEKGSEKSCIPADAIEISADEHARLMAEQAGGKCITASRNGRPIAVEHLRTDDDILAAVRAMRNRELSASDWTQLADATLSAAKKKAWADFRQKLRDLPGEIEALMGSGDMLPAIEDLIPAKPD